MGESSLRPTRGARPQGPLLLLALLSALLLVAGMPMAARGQGGICHHDTTTRSDCGYLGITAEECLGRGCCWGAVKPNPSNAPWCFHANTRAAECGEYVIQPNTLATRNNGFSVGLTYKGNNCTHYGPSAEQLAVEVVYQNPERARILISDPRTRRWAVPQSIVPRQRLLLGAEGDLGPASDAKVNSKITVLLGSTTPGHSFSLVAARTDTLAAEASGGFLLDTRHGGASASGGWDAECPGPVPKSGALGTQCVPLEPPRNVTSGPFPPTVFKNQFIQFTTRVGPKSSIFGLGERVRPLKLERNRQYTMWNADEAMPVNDNVYGSHPFYMELQPDGTAHGLLFLSSNGMDVELREESLSFNVIGGLVEVYLFAGPTPMDVVRQYTDLIGKPYMLPYWAQGWHQCRYGYKSLAEVQEVVRQYREHRIPLETMWIDIDYMDAWKDWTFDPVLFPQEEVAAFADTLHQNKQRMVLIVDPGIKVEKGYKYYDDGLREGVFILDSSTGLPAVGMVWPGFTVFPDFVDNPDTDRYWNQSIADFLNMVPVDGLWVDMNEIASFCTDGANLDSCSHPVFPDVPSFNLYNPEMDQYISAAESARAALHGFGPHPVSTNYKPYAGLDGFDARNPPYHINNRGSNLPLNFKTTEPDAILPFTSALQYDAHNIYGVAETISTRKALERITGKRAFVLSRSTFPGTGAHAGHWTGDNFSTWDHLYLSIPGMLQFQLFGIPYVGADICGFIGNTNEELCARWTQLGAFYPFARNHNAINNASQEPYLWEWVAESARQSIALRYSLFSVYYTLFERAHRTGDPVMRALFLEFPHDPETHAIDKQFMLGSSLLFTPVLEPGAESVLGYFPAGVWYDFHSGQVTTSSSTGAWLMVKAPRNVSPVHVRGGAIIPLLKSEGALVLEDVINSEYELLVALDAQGNARGSLFHDDGESLPPGRNTRVELVAQSNPSTGTVSLHCSGVFDFPVPALVRRVTVLGKERRSIEVNLSLNRPWHITF